MIKEPDFTIGIEEEYMLVDGVTMDLATSVTDELFHEFEALLGENVSREFMQCQIEVSTGICKTATEGMAELGQLRKSVNSVAEKHGLHLVAASTHPFSQFLDQEHTKRDRYDRLANDLQAVVQRLLISGMHVHIGIDDEDLRIDLMGQASYVLPHLLALSTSSPFWCGRDTGMKSYRMSVWDEMPRTGLPEVFESAAEYNRHVDVLVNVGIIEDASKIWWDIRPSSHFPTLEVRIPDVCTHVEDAVCIAAVYQCWLRMLFRLRRGNQRWRKYPPMLLNENRWRAHRYGIDDGLIDFGQEKIIPYAELYEEILGIIQEDAVALDCVKEVEHGREIIKRGTSAHEQIAEFQAAKAQGATTAEALKSVVQMLARHTTS